MGFSMLNFIYCQLFVNIPVPDVSFAGQTVIITGSNVGLGKESARHVVRLGASKVILAVRNLSAGEAAKADIEASTSRPGVCEVWSLDMSSFDSIKAFAKRAASLPRLDAVLENAGVATYNFEKVPTAGNHERTIAINVVGTFLLALLLLPTLRQTAKKYDTLPRLTIVASDAHAMAAFKEKKYEPVFEAMSTEGKADMAGRYPLSKLLEIMSVRQAAPEMGGEEGTDVVLNCVTPGLCHSELAREMGFWERLGMTTAKFLLARSTDVGGRLLVGALASGRKTHGKYLDSKVVTEPDFELVRSEEGQVMSKKVWKELKAILEDIQPNITSNLKA